MIKVLSRLAVLSALSGGVLFLTILFFKMLVTFTRVSVTTHTQTNFPTKLRPFVTLQIARSMLETDKSTQAYNKKFLHWYLSQN